MTPAERHIPDAAASRRSPGAPAVLRGVFLTDVSSRMRGLIARPPGWLAADEVVVLAPCASIHTFFMHVAIDVAFLDARGRVLRSVEALPPARLLSCSRASFVIERPTGSVCFAESARPLWPAVGETLAFAPVRGPT